LLRRGTGGILDDTRLGRNRLKLSEPSPAFLRSGRRLFRYLWQSGKCRFLRLPSGIGLYSVDGNPVGIGLPPGDRSGLVGVRTNSSSKPREIHSLTAFLFDFRPVSYDLILSIVRSRETAICRLSALTSSELSSGFGCVPVTPEDAFAAGNCWYGSKRWEAVFRSPAPTIKTIIRYLPDLPGDERAGVLHSCLYAAAYVIGTDRRLLTGVSPSDVERAETEGRKADSKGTDRKRRLDARGILATR
jgi:hypothetical protein